MMTIIQTISEAKTAEWKYFLSQRFYRWRDIAISFNGITDKATTIRQIDDLFVQ